ncbi:MAG: EAL domain-containing protein [Solirubrobacterales bacterium]|nr:EAL domain-containing protein [Solirubrobacterales bacterium]
MGGTASSGESGLPSLRPVASGWDDQESSGLQRLFAMVSDLVVVTSRSGEILLVNPAWQETLGWRPEELLGRSVWELVNREDRDTTEALRGEQDVANFTNRYRHKDGSWRWLLWSGRSDGELWYAVAKDVTDRLALERRALYDELTGLANRALLLDHLQAALTRLGRAARPLLAVLFIDLDGFKLVNDGHGHEIGDRLLVEASRRLRDTVRDSDMIGRFGGDEFVVVVEALGDEAEAGMLAERVMTSMQQSFELRGQRFTLSCSIGVAITSDPDAEPSRVLRNADIAMYRAKGDGNGRVAVFDKRARLEVAERVRVEHDLRSALQQDELTVLYQPVVRAADGTLVGCEALVRWRHPREGLVLPGRFIPLAEATGLIVELGEQVLIEACRQAGEWRRQGSDFTVSVNVSRRQLLEAGFVEQVRSALERAGVPGQVMCLEVTETAAPAQHPLIVEVLQGIRRLGVRIALDDFGAGYSSLTNLRELPIDVIKVDRSFVAGITDSDDDRGIVAAVLALARELGLGVVAEGVETEQQLSSLRALGCELAQGFLFAPALPAAELSVGGFSNRPQPGIGDPSTIREFMRQIGIPARIG